MRGQGMPMAGETGSVVKWVDGINDDRLASEFSGRCGIRRSAGRLDWFSSFW
jgi:hypothetical protein